MHNHRTPENITVLQSILIDYNKLVDDFAEYQIAKGVQLKPLQKASNDFLFRTRINNEALVPLLENYKTLPAGILPVGLLIRSVLSDFLTFCYLATFSHSKDANELSISNELALLERDFLKAMMEVGEIESRIGDYNEAIRSAFENTEDFEKHVTKLKEDFKHLFKSENSQLRLKKPKEFRETSLPECFDSKEEFGLAPSFMTEKYKWERMSKRGFGKYVIVFTAFKFFSQFQHYSPMSSILVEEITEPYAFFHLLMAIDSMIIVSDMQIQVIDGNDSSYLAALRELENKLDDILGAGEEAANEDQTTN